MHEQENRAVVERLMKSFEAGDIAFELYHDDAVIEWPQSGERINGVKAMRAMADAFPEGLPTVGTRRIIGAGDVWVVEWTGDYSGERYHSCSIAELRDGRVARVTEYFGSPFPAPEWRAPFAEMMT